MKETKFRSKSPHHIRVLIRMKNQNNFINTILGGIDEYQVYLVKKYLQHFCWKKQYQRTLVERVLFHNQGGSLISPIWR